MEQVDCIVIGAGVIGLAVARELAGRGRQVIILERESRFGEGVSSRNSEVIHAGIYYPAGSLKARLCVRGRELLYAFCSRYGVPHRRCGKLIVATGPEQEEALQRIRAHALANGVPGLERLNRQQALALEPELACTAALLSPATGILDTHRFMLSLLAQAEAAGALIAYRTAVDHLRAGDGGVVVATGGDQPMALRARCVINAAGLDAPALAARTRGLAPAHCPRAYYAKGSYFTLAGRSPFSHLIYPVPEPGGLGIHLTLDLGGQARFGPDVQWVEQPDYAVDPGRGDQFYQVIQRYWPGLRDGSLRPDYAGVRPKISGPGEAAADFRIEGPASHGVQGLINLFGIESPGLTASLAIAERVAAMAQADICPA
jgi:L-2-hydroxyglutarate oxidase LhgO